MSEQLTTKSLFNRDDVRKKFQEMLGRNSAAFITSVLQIVSSNALLTNADPNSIYHAAAVAATLNLPIQNALGMAYIIPYNQKQKGGGYKQVAQFQIGYKGYIQLAQRSGQIKTISATPVYEGQLVEENPLSGHVFDWKKKQSNKIIGYASYFQLLNGFEKIWYATTDEITAHALKYSQSFAKGYGLWKDDFEAMATKTVLKLLLSKYAPLSVEMQKALIADQAVVNDADSLDVTYVDNEDEEKAASIDPAAERIQLMLNDAKSMKDLSALAKSIPEEYVDLYYKRVDELKNDGGV